MMKSTQDIYLYKTSLVNAIGFDPLLDEEIEDTLRRIEDGTYEYVGEIKPRTKERTICDNYGW